MDIIDSKNTGLVPFPVCILCRCAKLHVFWLMLIGESKRREFSIFKGGPLLYALARLLVPQKFEIRNVLSAEALRR